MTDYDFNDPILKPFANAFKILGIKPEDLESDEIKVQLKRLEGVQVSFRDIDFGSKIGYALYRNEPVLIYIRDQRLHKESYEHGDFGRFHICYCRTLDTAKKNNRLESRYIVTANTSGEFLVNIRILWQKNYVEEGAHKRLKVCRNCLEKIKWNHYSKNWNEVTKAHAVESFSIAEFLKVANEDLRRGLEKISTHLVKDNYVLSASVKEDLKRQHKFTCQICKKCLLSQELEIHHIDHNPGNNSLDNLMVVCQKCHEAIHRVEGGYFGDVR